MPQSLQQRIVKSKATFPVTVVVAVLLWLVGVQWPLQGELPLVGWWGTMGCPVWLAEGGCLLLTLLAIYLLTELNNAYSLVGHRSTLHTSLFLLLWTSFPSLSHSVCGNLFLVCLLSAVSSLFRSYQNSLSVWAISCLFFYVGLASLLHLSALLLIPLFYVSMAVFRAFSLRTFFAGIVGFLFPYWVFFVYAFYTDEMGIFLAPWLSFDQILVWDYATIPLAGWLAVAYAALLFFSCAGYVLFNGRRYKIRTRLFLLFLIWWSFFGLLLVGLMPSAWWLMVSPVLLGVSLLAGHTFMLSSTRVSNIFFLVALVLLVVLSVYNSLWMF